MHEMARAEAHISRQLLQRTTSRSVAELSVTTITLQTPSGKANEIRTITVNDLYVHGNGIDLTTAPHLKPEASAYEEACFKEITSEGNDGKRRKESVAWSSSA